MAQLKTHKFVAALPPVLEADAIYFVRAGSGFDLYVTNHSGTIVAYPANSGGASDLPDINPARLEFLGTQWTQNSTSTSGFGRSFGSPAGTSSVIPQSSTNFHELNYSTGATTGGEAGWSRQLYEGTLRWSSARAGWVAITRVNLSDADYTGGGGSRFVAGVSRGSWPTRFFADSDNGYSGANGFVLMYSPTSPNWHVVTRNGATIKRVDTGIPFEPGYLTFTFAMTPGSSVINWRLAKSDGLVLGFGSVPQGDMPAPDGFDPDFGVGLKTLGAVSRNVRLLSASYMRITA